MELAWLALISIKLHELHQDGIGITNFAAEYKLSTGVSTSFEVQ